MDAGCVAEELLDLGGGAVGGGEQLREKSPEEAFPGKGNLSGEAARVQELEKQLRDVREERDILKKALAYFADDQK